MFHPLIMSGVERWHAIVKKIGFGNESRCGRYATSLSGKADCGRMEPKSVLGELDRNNLSTPPPRVSIGLPVYNGERYLAQAIAAVLGQDFRDLELIIHDN